MAHAFSPIPAKPTFGNITQSDYASDYIQNKIAKLAYCNDVRNANCKKKFSQSELLLFNKGRLLNSYAFCAGTSLINEANLVAGLYTESDLSGVAVVCDVSGDACITPTAINSLSVPFYEHYLIDPDGQLFGNTPCGMTNFTKYMSVPVISILGSPIDLIAIAEIGAVLLSWTAPMTSDRSPITDYRVYWSTDNPDAPAAAPAPASADAPIVGLAAAAAAAAAAPAVGWTLIDTKLVDSMYKVTGLANGITYYFKVEAVGLLGGGGAGTFSAVVSSTTLDIPGTPTGLVIVETGDGQVLLTWTAPESNGGSIITNYSIQTNNNNRVDTSWTSYTHPVSTTTSITLSGLTPGEPYWFRVAAINRVGMGPYLLSSAFTTLSSFVTPTTTGSVTRSVINNYNSYVFGPGSSTFTSNKNMTINFLVIAGGTSGQANSLGYTSSGGGSGGILQGTLDISANNPIDIVVGGGGTDLLSMKVTGYFYGWQGGASYILDPSRNISIISESCPTRSSPPNNYFSDSSAVDISYNYTGLPCTSTHHPDGPGQGAPGQNGHIMSLYGGYKNIMCSSSGGGGGGGTDTTTYAGPSPYLGGIAGIGAGNGGSSNFDTNNAGFGMDASGGSYGSGGGGAGSKSHGNYNYKVGSGANGVVIIYFTYPIVDPASVTPLPIISGPSAPIEITASIVNTNVSLTWIAPIYSGGTGTTISNYFVRYSDLSSNGPWTNISDSMYVTTNATIPLSLLSSNTTYYFQVAAINSAHMSGQWSGSASINTTLPDPPTNLTAVPSDSSVLLEWDAPAISTDIYYGINYSTDKTFLNDVIYTLSNDTSCNIPNVINGTPLINGTPYYFRVSSINGLYGSSSSFVDVSATPFQVVPTAPVTAPTITSVIIANSHIVLTWTPPTNTGGSPIINYNIHFEYDPIEDGSGYYIPYSSSLSLILPIDFYIYMFHTFTIAAINAFGQSPFSLPFSTPHVIPFVPRNIQIVSGNEEVQVLWDRPFSIGGTPITSYSIQYSLDNSSWTQPIIVSGIDITNNASSPIYSTYISGLSPDTEYWFKMAAVNIVGTGSYAISTPPRIKTFMTAPISLSNNGTTNNSVSLTWLPPNYTSGISNYSVQYSTDNTNWNTFTDYGSDYILLASQIVTDLSSNTLYYFRVAAENSSNNVISKYCDSITATTLPDPPTSLTADPSNGSVILSWTGPSNNYNILIGDVESQRISYGINYTTDDTSWNIVPDITTSDTSHNITGLNNGTPYYFRVWSINITYVTTSSLYADASATPMAMPLGSPISLQELSQDSSSILIRWLQPNNIINSTITDYIVQYSSDNKNTWTTFTHNTRIVPQNTIIEVLPYNGFWDASINVTDLSSNTSYYFRVAAVIANGTISTYGYSTTPYMTDLDVPTG